MSERICVVDGCSKKHECRGWCAMHYERWRKHGDPSIVLRPRRPKRLDRICSVEGCPRRAHAAGYCSGHYARVCKHGDPLPTLPIRKSRVPKGQWSTEQKLQYLTGPMQANGCTLWIGTKNALGYGHMSFDGRARLAHRVAYEVAHSVKLTSATPIHHTCSNRLCINPAHLQAITPQENIAEMLERKYYQNRIRELEAKLAELTEAA